MKKEESISFEQATTRIDEVVRQLEKGDTPLEKSLALFEEGVKLIEKCGSMLDDAELTVVRLQKVANGEPKETLFDDE